MKKVNFQEKHLLFFKDHSTKDDVYKNLWNKITNGIVWSGELRNKAKDGSYYWLKTTILPNFDSDKNIHSYTAISQNNTDKKIIEKLSQTDKLTQLIESKQMNIQKTSLIDIKEETTLFLFL